MSQNNDIIIRLSAEGVQAITGAFQRVSKAVTRLGKSVDTIAKRAALARKGLVAMGRSARTVAKAAGAAGAAVAGLGAATFALAGASAGRADEQIKEARTLGLTVEQYGRLLLAAEQAGLKSGEFGKALATLNDLAFEAATGSEEAADKLARIGVSAVDVNGQIRPTGDLLNDIADSFAGMPEGITKSALSMELFGSRGRRMINFLNNGSAGLENLGRQAEATGTIFSTEDAQLAEVYNDTLDRIGRTFRGIRDQVGVQLLPAMLDAAEAIERFVLRNNDAIVSFSVKRWKAAIQVVRDIVSVLDGAEKDVKTEWVRRAAVGIRDLRALFTGGDIESEFFRRIREGALDIAAAMRTAERFARDAYEAIRNGASIARDAYKILSGEEGPLENNALEPLRDVWNAFSDDVSKSYNNVIKPTLDELSKLLGKASRSLNLFFGLSGDSAITTKQLGIALVVAKLTGALGLLINVARLGLTVLATVFAGVSGIAAATVGLFASIRGARVAESQLEEVGQRANEIAAQSGDAAGAAYQLAFVESVKNRFGLRAANAIAGAFGSIGIGPGAVDFEGAETQLKAIVETDPEAAKRGFELAFSELGVPLRDGTAFVGTELDVQGATLSPEAQAQLSELETTLRVQGIELSDDVRRTLAEGLSTGASAAPLPAFSTGGRVFGPGTATSDSILARLSRGEFVIRAAAVKRFGAGFFERLNNGALPAFATGGLVSMPSPDLSAGLMSSGPARAGGRPVILNLPDGSQAELTGDADAVGALEKKLRRSATAQATRKPGWYR